MAQKPELEPSNPKLFQTELALKALFARRPVGLNPTQIKTDAITQYLVDHGLDIPYLDINPVVKRTLGSRLAIIDNPYVPDFRTGRGSVLASVLGGVKEAESYYQWVRQESHWSPPAAYSLLDHTLDTIALASNYIPPPLYAKFTNYRVFKTIEFRTRLVSSEVRQSFGVPENNQDFPEFDMYTRLHPIPPYSPLDVLKNLPRFSRISPRTNLG